MAEGPNAMVAELLARGAPATQVAAAAALARPERWRSLHQEGSVIWGEIISSAGAGVYRVAGLPAEPATSCTCPATRKPCKHGLALMMTFARAPDAFAAAPAPAWVTDWAEARAKRAARKPTEEIADPEAQARRAADREGRIAAGLDELERWLGDLVRQGFAGLDTKAYSFWDGPAARLVDAQAPGLARRVRALYGVVVASGAGAAAGSGPGWPERLLERLGLLYLLVQAYRKRDALGEDLRAEIRQLVGWNVDREELLSSAPVVSDRWRVLGWRIEEDERLRSQRIWLKGASSGRFALVLNFAPLAAPIDRSLTPGTTVDADLVFYPGVRAQRALVKARRGTEAGVGVVRGLDLVAAAGDYAAALAEDPWLDDAPVLFRDVVPVRHGGGWALRDEAGRFVSLSRRFTHEWTLAAIAGGRPVVVFGEWNGRVLWPLGAGNFDREAERYVPLDA
jgi:hypothetical protein